MRSPLPLGEIRMNVRMHSYELRRVRERGQLRIKNWCIC